VRRQQLELAGAARRRRLAATATRPPAAAPPTAVPATPVPAAAAPAATAAGAPVVPAAAVNAKRAACLRAIDALAGATDDSGALASPEARLLADQIPDLVTCGAIRKNTDVPCHTLLAKERAREIDCLSMRSMYNELRTYPKGRGFMFDDLKYAECQARGAGKFCDDFRAALRAGDVAQCDALSNHGYLCRAFVTMDVSACSPGAGKDDAPDCEKVIERNVLFGKGLDGHRQGAPLRDREFAKAAMGAPVACAALAQTAIDICAASLQP
jgi:hypothetical protein